MGKSRFEAFSDGVLAIIITIMVLELKVPDGGGLDALRPLLPVFLSYVLSFLMVGIYWANHHHLLQTMHRVTGGILWANLHLLFWLSLMPFITGWLGRHPSGQAPVAMYGVVLLMSGVSYKILQESIIASQGAESLLKKAVGGDWKGLLALGLYLTAIVAAFWIPALSLGVYVAVALLWLIPDRRIENALGVSARQP